MNMEPASIVTPPVSVTQETGNSSSNSDHSTDDDNDEQQPVILIDGATRKRSADRAAAAAALVAATSAHAAVRQHRTEVAEAARGNSNNNLLVSNNTNNNNNNHKRARRVVGVGRLKRSDSDLEDNDSSLDHENDESNGYESTSAFLQHKDGNNVVYVPKHAASPVASALTFTGSCSSSSSSDSGSSDAVVEFVGISHRKSPSHLHGSNKRNAAQETVAAAAAAAAPFVSPVAAAAAVAAAAMPVAAATAAAAAAPPGRANLGTADDPIDLSSSHGSRRKFTCNQFIDMWNKVNDDIGMDTEVIEDDSFIREANSSVSKRDSTEQGSAQYGRILFPATHRVLKKVLHLQRSDVFVDFGSGLGNTVVQAAYTMGCKSKGIEMVENRHATSLVYKLRLQELAESYARTKDEYQDKKPGKVILQRGRLESKASRRFLTNPGQITKAFCNNFGGVFGYRSARPGFEDRYNIDDYVGALFALMEPGSILATMYKLQLGPTRQQANAIRIQAGLDPSPNASFYDMEDVILGQARHVVSWSEGGGNRHLIHLYVYTRVQQQDKAQCEDDDGMHNSTVFLCSNMKCENAIKGIPLPATKFYEHTTTPSSSSSGGGGGNKEKPIKRLVINTCKCGYTAKMVRTRQKVNYAAK